MPTSKRLLCKLGPKYVEWIHDKVIAVVWPGVDPVSINEYRNLNLLESALARPFQSAGGQDAYPTVIEKAAALLHSLIANHPFRNGNKRTAVLAADAFLIGNGYSAALNNARMSELAQRTASYRERGVGHAESLQEIIDLLGAFSVPLEVFYREQRKDQSLAELYRATMTLRRSVRRNRDNEILKGQDE